MAQTNVEEVDMILCELPPVSLGHFIAICVGLSQRHEGTHCLTFLGRLLVHLSAEGWPRDENER